MTPKISERPLPTRNSSAPYEMPLKAWVSQNCVFIPSPTPLRSRKPDELPYDGFGRPQAPWRDESHGVLGLGGCHRRLGLALVAAAPALLRCRFFRRDDRQQEIGLPSAAGVQAGYAPGSLPWAAPPVPLPTRPAHPQHSTS